MVESLGRAIVLCAGLLAAPTFASEPLPFDKPFLAVPDNEFIMFGSRKPPPGTLNFWTLNCPKEGAGGGCGWQWDIDGKLGASMGTCSGLFNSKTFISRHCRGAYDDTTTITSTRGLRLIISDTGVPQDKTLGEGLLTLDKGGNVSVTRLGYQLPALIGLATALLATWAMMLALYLRMRRT